MNTKKAQEKSITFITGKVHGTTVWPISYGVQAWLTARKNKVALMDSSASDYDCAEFVFAFTKDPVTLQSITGASAKKQINELLMASSMAKLMALYKYSIDQLLIYAKTLPVPKKKQAAAKARKPALKRR